MMIVEDNVEVKLLYKLEQLRDSGKTTRCIEMQLSTVAREMRPNQRDMIGLVQSIFAEGAGQAQLYFHQDGDVVLFLEQVQARQMRLLAAMLPMGTENYLKLYEFNHQLNMLMVRVQEKIDAAQARADAENKKLIQAIHARKREQVLSYTPEAIDIQRLQTARQKRAQREIMIIEDDAFSRRLLENILPKTHHTISVGEPDQALERYVLAVPDVLFLDINLPDVNGHELLEKILSIDPNAYIIMISGNSDRENVIRAMSRGARGFIAKPFARERVKEYLDRCPTLPSELPHAHS